MTGVQTCALPICFPVTIGTEEIDISKLICDVMTFVTRKREERIRNIVNREKVSRQTSRQNVTDGIFSQTGERDVSGDKTDIPDVLVPIYVTSEISRFVGIDGRTYGPFRPDEVASIPTIHAKNLAERGFIRIIGGKK